MAPELTAFVDTDYNLYGTAGDGSMVFTVTAFVINTLSGMAISETVPTTAGAWMYAPALPSGERYLVSFVAVDEAGNIATAGPIAYENFVVPTNVQAIDPAFLRTGVPGVLWTALLLAGGTWLFLQRGRKEPGGVPYAYGGRMIWM